MYSAEILSRMFDLFGALYFVGYFTWLCKAGRTSRGQMDKGLPWFSVGIWICRTGSN